jgi:hypothetical protein
MDASKRINSAEHKKNLHNVMRKLRDNGTTRYGLSSVPIKKIIKLHPNVILTKTPLINLNQWSSVVVFTRSGTFIDNNWKNVHMNIILKINNVCVHYKSPHEAKLELLYFIKEYQTIPIVLEKHIYDVDMTYDVAHDSKNFYNEESMSFKIKRQYFFDHVSYQMRYFINHGIRMVHQHEHVEGKKTMVHFGDTSLPGICTSIFLDKRIKKSHVSFDYADLLNNKHDFFIYPQLL